MAEEAEDRVPGASGADPAATAMALGGASRAEADAFLKKQGILSDKQSALADKQSRILDLQIDELSREDSVRHWSLRVHHISDVLKLGFELAAAAVVTAIAIAIGAAVWSAAHDDGLVIEAFAVPADMAAKGLTGQVVATQFQDRLAWMQAHTDTIRQAGSFRNNWGDDIRVQIPDTGVSIGEFYRYLADWLGHETRISGEVWRTPDGLALSVRSGSEAAQIFTGKDADIAKLVAEAAEHVYGRTQPYRYAVFLDGQNRPAEAEAATRALAENGAAEERPWAYSRWSLRLLSIGDLHGALEKQRIAAELGPDLPHIWGNLAEVEAVFGHDEAALHDNERLIALVDGPKARELAAYAVNVDRITERIMVAEAFGDFRGAATLAPSLRALPDYSESRESADMFLSADLASDHDIAASRRLDEGGTFEVRAMQMMNGYSSFDTPPLSSFVRAAMLDNWKAAREDLTALERLPAAQSAAAKPLQPVFTWPWLAYADAKLGDFASAGALIDRTPGDCYLCVRMRGNIDAAQGKWAAAAWWFDDATRQAPSIPFAYTDWGAMLLRKGNYVGAIAKFTLANTKGPHFADPLEMWGEALTARKRSDLALAKFAEADKYAPNWGRLHLKWGEALLWTGDKVGAQKQFAVASNLDFAPQEKSELQRMRNIHG